jgi:hypothetical protein
VRSRPAYGTMARRAVHGDQVFRAPGLMGDCIALRGKHYLDWTIYAFSLEPILLTLEELGYPVDWIHRTP